MVGWRDGWWNGGMEGLIGVGWMEGRDGWKEECLQMARAGAWMYS